MINKIQKLNDIFRKLESIHNETKDKNTRNKKISIHDAILYQFNYSNINKTKESIVSDFNYENKHIHIHKTSMYRKERNISVNLYKKLYFNIKELYDSEFKNLDKMKKVDCIMNQNYVDLELYNIYAVDGTNNNTIENSKLISNLNMCMFDCNGFIPIDIFSYKTNKFVNNKNNISNKNNEVHQFMKYTQENKIENAIVVCDRAYFKYELFDLLEEKKLKYVIRIKDNCNLIKENFIFSKKDKNFEFIKKIKNNPSVKIISYNINTEKQLQTKTNEIKNVFITNKYHLITNLADSNITNENIRDIYNSRWNIEVFFKILKKNFKFSHLLEKDELQHAKIKYISLIMLYITKIIICYGFMQKKKKDIQTTKSNIKVNISNLINGINSKLLKSIISSKLSTIKLKKIINSYFIIRKHVDGRHFVRKSLLPFSKWYVKMYHSAYEYNKIIEAVENNRINDLNKNLKVKSKNIKLK